MNESLFHSNKFDWVFSPFPILNKQLQLSDDFYIMKNAIKKLRHISLISNFLIVKSPDGSQKWTNYENSFIYNIYDQKLGLGIKLKKGQDIFEFYGDTELWYNFMRKFTIQSNFYSNYTFQKKIGSGSFAHVLLARNKFDGSNYAIKYVEKTNKLTDIDQKQLLKELSILRSLQHEQISQLIEVYEDEKAIYLVMQYLKGGDLLQLIETKTDCLFNEEEVAIIIYQLFNICSYLHKKGIMHRDIKPENILFKTKGDLKSLNLSDFGLADYYNKESNYLFTRCGTPGYVAPELLQDLQYDYKVDVFSIGIIMYLLLTGLEPFNGEYQEKVQKNYFGKIDFHTIDHISKFGQDLLKKILCINPQKRINSQLALQHPWFEMYNLGNYTQKRQLSQNKISQMDLKKTSFLNILVSPKTNKLLSSRNLCSLPTSPIERSILTQRHNNTSNFNSLVFMNKEKNQKLIRARIKNLIKD